MFILARDFSSHENLASTHVTTELFFISLSNLSCMSDSHPYETLDVLQPPLFIPFQTLPTLSSHTQTNPSFLFLQSCRILCIVYASGMCQYKRQIHSSVELNGRQNADVVCVCGQCT